MLNRKGHYKHIIIMIWFLMVGQCRIWAQAFMFAPAVNYSVGVAPGGICSADFNNDGSVDLGVANYNGGQGNTITVLTNMGAGTYSTSATYTTVSNVFNICSNDFNKDGWPDLAATNTENGNSLNIMMNNGSGGFIPQTSYPPGLTGGGAFGICSSDLNNDTWPDIVLTNNSTGYLSVLLNNGSGAFTSMVTYSFASGMGKLTTADLNEDGYLDIIVAVFNHNNNVLVYTNDGNAGFGIPTVYTAGDDPYDIAVADFNGDNKLDVAVTNFYYATVSVLFNNGVGILGSPVAFPGGVCSYAMKAADFNSDGKCDLVVTDYYSTVRILLNQGGTFSSPVSYTVGSVPGDIVAKDLDNDGKIDLAVCNNVSNDVSVLLASAEALNFDGIDDYVAVNTLSGIPYGNNPRTIELWFRTSNSGTDMNLLNYGVQNTGQEFNVSINNAGNIYFSNGGPQRIQTAQIVNDGIWHHLAATYSGGPSNIFSLYVDGQKDTNLVMNLNTSNSGNLLYLGSLINPTTASPFEGDIDEFRIWNRELCQQEIQNNMSAELMSGSAFGLVGYYSFNTGHPRGVNTSFSTLQDVSGNSNNGSLTNFSLTGTTSNWIAPGALYMGNMAPLFSIPSFSVNASVNPICIGSTSTLLAGGTVSTYTWSTSQNTASVVASPTVSTIYTVWATDVGNCVSTKTIQVSVNNTCADVWPGDANSDGAADNLDILELGLHYYYTGPARSITSNMWQSYYASNWSGTISNGRNLNHSDCNGDGVINQADTFAIYTNYGQTHLFKPSEQTTVTADLKVIPDQPAVLYGNWGTASVYLGDSTNQVNNINGIAYSLTFDHTLIDPNNIYIEYPVSFLNATNQNLHFRKLDFNNNVIYTATTHTFNNNVSGNGKIAIVHYKIRNTAGLDTVLNIGISTGYKSNVTGSITTLTTGSATLSISALTTGIKEVGKTSIHVYPNPASTQLTISSIEDLQKVELQTLTGQVLQSTALSGKQTVLDLAGVSEGIYFIQVYSHNQGIRRQKVVVQR